MSAYRHLFGPVPSRRLGRSLGVDLTPRKTCTLNCLYCQLGCTDRLTVTRREDVPTAEVFAELAEWAQSGESADAVTLAGSGEPTLHSRFGDVLAYARERTGLPGVLLTNGTLLHLPEVREGAARADIVKITLSAWDQASFERLHRPHPEATFKRLLAGEEAFRRQFKGRLWVEFFVLRGINDGDEQVCAVSRLIERMAPDRIHLNTAVRPAAEADALPASRDRLHEIAGLLGPRAEVVADFRAVSAAPASVGGRDVLALLRRHPSTLEQLAAVCRLDRDAAAAILEGLLRDGMIRLLEQGTESYYAAR